MEREKQGRRKKEAPEAVLKLIGLANLYNDLSILLDTLDSCAASGIPEPGTIPLAAQGSAVKVMTIHASKGLEFEQVFVPALEEGMLPFTLFDKPEDGQNTDRRGAAERIEEERRLLYVAMTRAKQGLWLSCSESRIFRGRKLQSPPSRFLTELEKIIPLAQEQKARKWDGQLNLF